MAQESALAAFVHAGVEVVEGGFGVVLLGSVKVRVADERRGAGGGSGPIEDRGLAVGGVGVPLHGRAAVVGQGGDAVLLVPVVIKPLVRPGSDRPRSCAIDQQDRFIDVAGVHVLT